MVVNQNFEPHAKTQFSISGAPITCIAFNDAKNNKNQLCAVGGADGIIKIYDVQSKFKKFSIIKKISNSPITHIDFSVCNRKSEIRWALQANNADGEVHYFNATPDEKGNKTCGKVINDYTLIRDHEWFTHTCTVGWNVQGIIPSNGHSSDILACAKQEKGDVIATADIFGKVNLYRYPCPNK
jgi:echinoderm microtubule-associated protein-like 1/2